MLLHFPLVDTFIYFFYAGDEVREDGGGYTVVLNDQ